MKFLAMIILLITSSCIGVSVMAQSEQGYILGMKYFEKSFPSDPASTEDYDYLYHEEHFGSSTKYEKLGQRSIDIIGKELSYTYPTFSIDLVIISDYEVYCTDSKTGKETKEQATTIHIDKYKTLTSWKESDNTIVTIFSDFKEGKTSAFLFRSNGEIIPVSGIIKMNNER